MTTLMSVAHRFKYDTMARAPGLISTDTPPGPSCEDLAVFKRRHPHSPPPNSATHQTRMLETGKIGEMWETGGGRGGEVGKHVGNWGIINRSGWKM